MKSVLRWHVLYDLAVRMVDELDVNVNSEEEREEVSLFLSFTIPPATYDYDFFCSKPIAHRDT
jgi:hypothetical protein